MVRRILVTTASAASLLLPAVAAHAGSPAVFRGVELSTGNATITPTTCSTTTRVVVDYTDPDRQGPPPGSGIVVTNAAANSTAGIVRSTTAWRNGVSSVTYVLRLCGFGQDSYPVTEPGWYRIGVRLGPQEKPANKAGFALRYQAQLHFSASPEPVRRGGLVTVTASVTDGWEYFDNHPVRFYFRRAGATAWRDFGTANALCVELCDIGAAAYSATRRYRQTVSGTWKAVSQRTSYLESGSRADAVAVR